MNGKELEQSGGSVPRSEIQRMSDFSHDQLCDWWHSRLTGWTHGRNEVQK